jgi:nucleoside-diphosphate-sugar epimerase
MSKLVLITGASGEIGKNLLAALSKNKDITVVAFDRNQPQHMSKNFIKGDITDRKVLKRLFSKHKFHTVFHLASLLSVSSERSPQEAHRINVDGTLNLLEYAKSTRFIFTSSIAVYGLPSLYAKEAARKITEDKYNFPLTMYGANKLYAELLGQYFNRRYGTDFRAVRLPGVISTNSLPSGGTSDFAPEMIHSAAYGKNYTCFVRPSTKIPFILMPDAIRALLLLSSASSKSLCHRIYNIAGFSASAKEIEKQLKKHFPAFKVSYKPDSLRQMIADSWPASIDDSKARKDLGWKAKYNSLEKAINQYLIPTLLNKISKDG